MKAKVFSPKTKYSKLLLVKNIKEITGLFLKESKFLADDLETQDFITIDVNKNIDKHITSFTFNIWYYFKRNRNRNIRYS